MLQPTQAKSSNQEDRLLQAIQALKEHQFKSVRAAALSYDVPRRTLSNRMNGMTSRRDSTSNLQKLTPYEESALVQINWTTTFIKRRTEIKAKFSWKYDYKRAKCEDPKIIKGWFSLVRNTVAKYGILEQDIYNFNEAGFAMGVIATAKLEFLSAFKEAFKAAFTEQNIKSGFRATGLVP
ncbi:hypothetical protein V499_01665, partial [Pseudogymnoascus sp. VKM F-103]